MKLLIKVGIGLMTNLPILSQENRFTKFIDAPTFCPDVSNCEPFDEQYAQKVINTINQDSRIYFSVFESALLLPAYVLVAYDQQVKL